MRKCLTCVVQQYVLWFQVSIDDPVLVKMLHPTDDLSRVETCSFLIETRILFIHVIHMKPVRGGGGVMFIFLKVLRNQEE